MLGILASGLLGALLATILGAAFSFLQEQARLRADVMLTVVGWADDTYLCLTDLLTSKGAAYSAEKAYLTDADFAANSRELRSLLVRASVPARLALVYGEGDETRLLNALRGKLLQAAVMLWKSRKEEWKQVDARTKAFVAEQIDPLRRDLERRLLESASIPIIWLRLKRRIKDGPDWSGVDFEGV